MEYVTGDWHLRHGNILKHSKRLPFLSDYERKVVLSGDSRAIQDLKISRESSDRMNDAIVDNTNKVVGENDHLILLGDVVWSTRDSSMTDTLKTWRYYREKIRCRNVSLVWGNHDPKQDTGARREIAKLFQGAYDLYNLKMDGKKAVCSHYAMAIWDGRHHGSYHFYGHSHSNSEVWLDSIMPGRWSMDCGIDNAYKILGQYRPFSWTELVDIFSKRPGFGLLGGRDYHHDEA